MRRWIVLLPTLFTACGSDNELGDLLDPDGIGSSGTASVTPPPGGGEDTATPYTDPGSTFPGDDTGGDPLDPSNPGGDTGLTEDEICEAAAALASILDPYQTASDGRVTYCHSASGGNYHLVDSDISSCLPHLNHDYDVFPTSGCDT